MMILRFSTLTVAIDEFSNEYVYDDLWEDAVFKALFNIDLNLVTIKGGKVWLTKDKTLPIVEKKNISVSIPSGLFDDEPYASISGVLFINPKLRRPKNELEQYVYDIFNANEKLEGRDFVLYINHNAKKIISKNILDLFRQMGVKIVRCT